MMTQEIAVERTQNLRIMLADDHEVVRRGLRALIESEAGWTVCGEASDGASAVDQVAALAPDVVLMDVAMPQLNGIEATRRIVHGQSPRTVVLILSARESESLVQEALAAGARGFMLKSDAGADLLGAVKSVSQGRPFFSARVAEFVVQGYMRSGTERTGPSSGGAVKPLLTARERQVLQLLAEGKSNKQVASALEISVKTAESHRANLMKKLRVGSLSDLVRYAIRNQMIEA
jgi:DNA-binding NarL/FixJ family response regulator